MWSMIRQSQGADSFLYKELLKENKTAKNPGE